MNQSWRARLSAAVQTPVASDELLPCPCCSNKAIFHETDDGATYIECMGALCRLSSRLQYSCMEDCRHLLAEAWNRRATLPDISAALECIAGMEAAARKIEDIVNKDREPAWSYRNTITTNRNAIREQCALILGRPLPPPPVTDPEQ